MTTTRVDPVFEPIDTSKTLFELLGGERYIRELVDRFYDLMDIEPNLKELRATHGPSLNEARDKLFWFFMRVLWRTELLHPAILSSAPACSPSSFLHRRTRARSMGGLHGQGNARSGDRACLGRAPGAVVLRRNGLDA